MAWNVGVRAGERGSRGSGPARGQARATGPRHLLTIALARSRPLARERRVRHAMVGACALRIAAGPSNLLAERVVAKDRAARFFAWWFALALIGYALLLARVWSRASVSVVLDDGRRRLSLPGPGKPSCGS